jgi:hypothetical protein
MQRLPFALLLVFIAPAIAAQQPPAATVEMHDGGSTVGEIKKGVRAELLQSIFIPPLKNAPFSATVLTEWKRTLPDGGTFTLVNSRPVARDSEGRIYQERWTLVPPSGKYKSQITTIQISDPNAHTFLNCFTLNKPLRCTLEDNQDLSTDRYVPVTRPSGPLRGMDANNVHQDLGTQTIEGVETKGTRDTIDYAAGAFGNDQPTESKREYWFAPTLGINLLSIVIEPTFGKQTFTITDVKLGEPDPGLFIVPQGYAVEDHREPHPPQK